MHKMRYMNNIKQQLYLLVGKMENSNFPNFNYDYKDFYSYITKNEYTSSMIKTVYAHIDYEKLKDETEGEKALEMIHKYRMNKLKINSKYERIYYLLRLLEYIDRYTRNPFSIVQNQNFEYEGSFIKGFVKVVISPIVDYFTEGLVDDSQTLSLLLRYKKSKEWFNRQQFFENYDKLGRSEDFLDMDLRYFLYQNGIDYPFSTTKSPSGRTDIIANLQTNDPIVLEVKVIDSTKGYTKSRITSGFSQCVKYTNDYNKNVGYIVVFNADKNDKEIVFETNSEEYPTRVQYNGKNIFIVVVNINPEGKSASKIGKIDEIRINLNDLTNTASA